MIWIGMIKFAVKNALLRYITKCITKFQKTTDESICTTNCICQKPNVNFKSIKWSEQKVANNGKGGLTTTLWVA